MEFYSLITLDLYYLRYTVVILDFYITMETSNHEW